LKKEKRESSGKDITSLLVARRKKNGKNFQRKKKKERKTLEFSENKKICETSCGEKKESLYDSAITRQKRKYVFFDDGGKRKGGSRRRSAFTLGRKRVSLSDTSLRRAKLYSSGWTF